MQKSDEHNDHYEMVDKPKHYSSKSGKQVIDLIEEHELCFYKGNILKYVMRAGKKPDQSTEQDLKKARWYFERMYGRNRPLFDFNQYVVSSKAIGRMSEPHKATAQEIADDFGLNEIQQRLVFALLCYSTEHRNFALTEYFYSYFLGAIDGWLKNLEVERENEEVE